MPKRRENRQGKWYQQPWFHTTVKILSGVFRCLLTILLIMVITGCIVGCALTVYVVTNFDVSDSVPDLKQINANTTSIIYTQNQSTGEWEEFTRLEGANHLWVDIDQIPLYMQQAVIAIEDERFETHYGVDWKRTISAFANLILKFSSTEYGGSTITQQLVKILTGDNSHDITRKMTEILRAIDMEKNYTKEEILEAYLNLLPLTGDIQGVAVGANYYFGKEIQDLTLAECAALASITQNPSYYHPYYHPENLRDRQQTVLYKMYDLGYITEDEYTQALGQELIFKSSVKMVSTQDYYTDMVVESVINDLIEQYGYGYEQAEAMVYYGGLNIYSYENPDLQERIEALYRDESIYPASREGDAEDPRVAFFAVDYDGRVVATVGDRGEKTGDRVSNIATMSKRQPGSAIKPLASYSLAIEYNLAHYSTMLVDEPTIRLPSGELWPPNYNNEKFGTIPVEMGLQASVNTIAVKLLSEVGLQRSFNFLTDVLNFSTLVEATEDGASDINYAPLGLGGFTYGVYMSELTAAYEIFGNGGYYNGFYCYDRVERDGTVLLQNEPLGVRAIEPDTSYVMNRLMQRVIRGPRGTLRQYASSWNGWEIFAKTGTTDANNDVVAIGGTPYYVASCWFGYRYNQEMTYTQAQAVKSLWNLGMLELHKGLSPANFDEFREDTVEHAYCTSSGMLATSSCPSTAIGVYRASNTPGYCTQHGGTVTTPSGDGEGTTGTASGTPSDPTGSDSSDTTGTTQSEVPSVPSGENPAADASLPEETSPAA